MLKKSILALATLAVGALFVATFFSALYDDDDCVCPAIEYDDDIECGRGGRWSALRMLAPRLAAICNHIDGEAAALSVGIDSDQATRGCANLVEMTRCAQWIMTAPSSVSFEQAIGSDQCAPHGNVSEFWRATRLVEHLNHVMRQYSSRTRAERHRDLFDSVTRTWRCIISSRSV